MKYRVFSKDQVEQFIERGFVKLEEAFPKAQALAAQDFLWTKLEDRGIRKDDESTWTEPMVNVRETYDEPVFRACMTERLQDAIEDLVGIGRWADRGRAIGWGWWPVNFSQGADQPWDIPRGGWHWDGIQFRHTVTAPDQGLLLLPHFSEVGPHGGGTLVAAGSHEIVARFLARHPEGLELRDALPACNQDHPWLAELTGVTENVNNRVEAFLEQETADALGTSLRVMETTAAPGDVVFCHPFLYHAASPNHSGVPRFMCNRTTPLREPMCLNRNDGDYSPVETSIRHALTHAGSL